MSRLFSVKIRADLQDIADKRARLLGYPSRNAYVKALMRRDAAKQSAHLAATQWARLPPAEQDALDARLLDGVKKAAAPAG